MSDHETPELDNQPEELSEDELDQVAGGACATGQHIKEGMIVVRSSSPQTQTTTPGQTTSG